MNPFQTVHHKVDFCVVGGGMAGLCAAVAAARRGAKTVLMQDRAVLGGNASSEIRMWICGAHGDNNKETGIVEEIELENCYRNPSKNYSIWDSILYEKAKAETNLTLLLNCSCLDAKMDNNQIVSVTGWQMTTQKFHTVEAALFADCSGDSILAPLSGALTRMGREAREEFDEDIAPEKADRKTMGMSCLIQARQTDHQTTYIPPAWARKFTREDLPFRQPNLDDREENFWYLELGGTKDTIADTEEIRDELLKAAFGIWDYVKNSGECNADNWELDWVGFLPGKRESRRYVGEYLLTQNDVRSGGHFDDLVAYGGWTMDDHHPEGLDYPGNPNIFHPAPSPFGIPYRCLYSKNIRNLMFAGRNISVTHTAMSSTRVLATCSILGQAVGTAAALAASKGITPHDVYLHHMETLRTWLMEDDCYLPFTRRPVSELTKSASITGEGDVSALTNGYDRPVDGQDNGYRCPRGSAIHIRFDQPTQVRAVRLVLDSDLNRETIPFPNKNSYCNLFLDFQPNHVPTTVLKKLQLNITAEDGTVRQLLLPDNHQRVVNLPVNCVCRQLELLPLDTWGAPDCHLFSLDLL